MFIIDDIARAVRAIAEAIKARYDYKGLSTQEKQDDGKRDSELATRLLTSIYRYRDAMSGFMNPFITLHPESQKEAPHLSEEQRLYQAREKFENKRNKEVICARERFYDDILTSEALWGDEIRLIVEEMCKIENIVRKRIGYQLMSSNPDETPDKKQEADQMLRVMFEGPTNSFEALAERFNEQIQKAEDYLKQKRNTT